MPKVSVIIPTYNRSEALRDTIASVLRQSEEDLELIVVDDGSTDDTAEVVSRCSDARVRYFHQPNGGPASARNCGLAHTRGAYVAFLDHDDLWPADFLQIMIAALEENPSYGVAYAPITLLYGDGRRVASYKRAEGKSGWLTADLFQHGFVWTSATLIRREVITNLRYDESLKRSYEDADFFLRLSARVRYLFVPNVQAVKTEHAGNLSHEVGVQPTRILVLERFYSRLGGDRIIPPSIAKRRLGHACRTVAEEKRRQSARTAAVTLYERAISYWPYDWRPYVGLGKALLLPPRRDSEPGWHMPDPLPSV